MPDSSKKSKSSKTLRFTNAKLWSEKGISEGDLFVKDGLISSPIATPDETIDCQGMLLSPGFIDLQINGAKGVDFTSQPEKWPEVAALLPSFGVTSFLATILSQPLNRYQGIVSKFLQTKAEKGAECLGLHLEGPYLNPARRGAHAQEDLVETGDIAFWKELLKVAPIKMITLAPELPGMMELIAFLSKNGVVVSCGHTEALSETLLEAKNNGLKFVTHLYNAMSPLHHRNPGVIGTILGEEALAYSIIADGVHVHPQAIAVAWKAHPKGTHLISDANAFLGTSQKEAILGGHKIERSENGAFVSETQVLAGGMVPMNEIIWRFSKMSGCSIEEAIACATLRPAILLGIEKKKGSLQIGSGADITMIRVKNELSIFATYIGGNCVYRAVKK